MTSLAQTQLGFVSSCVVKVSYRFMWIDFKSELYYSLTYLVNCCFQYCELNSDARLNPDMPRYSDPLRSSHCS